MSPEMQIGKGSAIQVNEEMSKIMEAGAMGPMLLTSMFEQVSAVAEAHGAPDNVKEALVALKVAVEKWMGSKLAAPAGEVK